MDLIKDLEYDKKVLLTALKVALLNAAKHEGKANQGSVIGGVLGDHPEVKKDMKELSKTLSLLIKKVNSLPIEEQKELLLQMDSKALDKKEKDVDLFKNLTFEDGERVITAFPPSPEKQPHIGHVKALLLNYLLAKEKKGKFIFRFEDTNPTLVKEEYYEIMLNDFKWLNISWDEVVYASDHMNLYYKHCEDLIKEGKAYACNSSSEEFKVFREKGINPPAYKNSVDENLRIWNKMLTNEVENYVIRLKIDINHKNSTMREPAIMRILNEEHARQGSKYVVWPAYDFQNSIMDGYYEVTHRLRSKEFEMRNELQRYIQNMLGYKETQIYEFARFNLKGVESSGRKIREGIETGKFIGWDDPKLTTLAALRRRGFKPEAIKNFIISTGVTKSESTLTWDDLIMHNKRLLDETSKRYFFVEQPVKLNLEGEYPEEINLNILPGKKGRTLKISNAIYISKNDFDKLKENKVYRFISGFNFEYLGNQKIKGLGTNLDYYKEKGEFMLHFLPENEYEEGNIMMPDHELKTGFVEKNNVSENEVVQFERFGFCKLDKKDSNSFWFTHN